MKEIYMPNSNRLNEGKASARESLTTKENGSLAEISKKWLADISADDFNDCHEYLAAVRLARHMSKIDVCRASQSNDNPASGVSLPTVSKIESGSYGEPGFRTMVRLARGYGVPLSSLERFFT
jgi:hypothetical protein